ncbi:MAG: hypothetical protein R3F49_05910 [Planctomycetota bacterium]
MQGPLSSLVCASLALVSAASAQVVQDLGSFGGPENMGLALSADGAIVVGYSYDPQLRAYAFRWSAATGMQNIGDLGGSGGFAGAYANGVSMDGDCVVGDSRVPAGSDHAFRWVNGAGMQDLGTLGGTTSSGKDVSADGQVVVGFSTLASGHLRAFRWTPVTGMVDLGTLGGLDSFANGVSADGTVVVGWASDAAGQQRACRWSATAGLSDLGTLGGVEASAAATNGDGSVVVGSSKDAAGQTRAFRWTQAGGMQRLDDLGGAYAAAIDVDEAGDVVVANGAPAVGGGSRGFRWSAATGPVALEPDSVVQGVSADGGAAAGFHNALNGDLRAVRWRWSTIGAPYCSAEPNSLGAPATLAAYGSLDVTQRDLALRAQGLPDGSWSFVISAPSAGVTFPLPGSQGRLCLGAAIGAHYGPGEVQRADASGALVWVLDPGALPTPTGTTAALPGDTWHFQVWYRDANPSATSNLTEARAVPY